jgi:hypothetical protein
MGAVSLIEIAEVWRTNPEETLFSGVCASEAQKMAEMMNRLGEICKPKQGNIFRETGFASRIRAAIC